MAQAHHSIAQFNFKTVMLMIHLHNMQQLADRWTEKMQNPQQSLEYKNALSECIYELNSLINQILLDEITEEEAREYMLEQDADYFSNIEPEESYATAI